MALKLLETEVLNYLVVLSESLCLFEPLLHVSPQLIGELRVRLALSFLGFTAFLAKCLCL